MTGSQARGMIGTGSGRDRGLPESSRRDKNYSLQPGGLSLISPIILVEVECVMAEKKKAASKAAKAVKGAKPGKQKKTKRKTNLYKLYSDMNKRVHDAVDKEVVKRFKTLIDTSAEEITKSALDSVLHNPLEAEASNYEEGIQPYIKHYIFMVKRGAK